MARSVKIRKICVSILLLFAVFFLILIIVNTIMGQKGFYYDPAIPNSDFIFLIGVLAMSI